MAHQNLLAFDFGASSGRAIYGAFDGDKLTIEEIHRFPNDPVKVAGHLYWDILRLFFEIKQGFKAYAQSGKGNLDSFGIDTWGVDFGLLDEQGQLLANPYHYRDILTEGMFEEAFLRVSKEVIFEETGIAFLPFNTLYQLLALKLKHPTLFNRAETLLLIPDLFLYFLTGIKKTEFTDASTGQLLSAQTGTWDYELIDRMGLPRRILTEIEAPGSIRGSLLSEIAEEVGLSQGVKAIAVAEHDTASAVAAVPAGKERFAYLSSGTWSLLGTEVATPITSKAALDANYTNEGGVQERYRLLKNIMGMWIIQECKREWEKGGTPHPFEKLVIMAEGAKPFGALIDPDEARFGTPGNMVRKIQDYCRETGQMVPREKAEIVRCVYESLALKYRWSMERLEEIVGEKMPTLHIVGGGSKNNLMNRLTASALNRPVLCGPVEATAIGNLMVQAIALGEVKDLDEARQVVARSFDIETFLPKDVSQWDDAYGRFLGLLK